MRSIFIIQNPWLEAWNFDQEETATADGNVNAQGNTNAYTRVAKMADTFARALVTGKEIAKACFLVHHVHNSHLLLYYLSLILDDQSTFLMGGIGSSVMAGHDNCHYDRLVAFGDSFCVSD